MDKSQADEYSLFFITLCQNGPTFWIYGGDHPDIKEWQLSTPVFSVGNQHIYTKLGYIEISRNDDEIEYVKLT